MPGAILDTEVVARPCSHKASILNDCGREAWERQTVKKLII